MTDVNTTEIQRLDAALAEARAQLENTEAALSEANHRAEQLDGHLISAILAIAEHQAENKRLHLVYDAAIASTKAECCSDCDAGHSTRVLHKSWCPAFRAACDVSDAVEEALAAIPKWARCEEPPDGDGVAPCGWAGEMEQLDVDEHGVTRCPACGSTAIKEDLPPPENEGR